MKIKSDLKIVEAVLRPILEKLDPVGTHVGCGAPVIGGGLRRRSYDERLQRTVIGAWGVHRALPYADMTEAFGQR